MPTVGIIGAGTMGAGIAQVAAAHGWEVRLLEVDPAVAREAVVGIGTRFDRLVEKGRLSAEQGRSATDRLAVANGPDYFAGADLIVEAVVEDLSVKAEVFKTVAAAVGQDCILASNTSSLSISKIGQASRQPARLVGMHFFNPVPLMPLVEVVTGSKTDPAAAKTVARIAQDWGKTVVRCKDTPGFIVNRVARGYYLESLRMLGEGIAGIDEIDGIMKRLGGFAMGPFELMDLVGIDVNYTVSCSVYDQLNKPARLKPHPLQRQLFERRHLGRKTGRGFYTYEDGAALPAVPVERSSFDFPNGVQEAVQVVCAQAIEDPGSPTEQYVFARVLAAIINEAALAYDEGVATSNDIDTAMKTGTKYPHGPLEWADRIGFERCRHLLDALNAQTDDGRFAPAGLLRR
ncbi:MAG: 3-hydroxyacyl-CoA dehydrogenase NAD-binding domain-containing protein [Phycisphaerae bacterium]